MKNGEAGEIRKGLNPQYCCVMLGHDNMQVSVLNCAPTHAAFNALYKEDHYTEVLEYKKKHLVSSVNNSPSYFVLSTAQHISAHLQVVTLYLEYFIFLPP